MTETTPLDAAHAAMQAAPDDDALRLRFYEHVGDNELFLLLGQEPEDDAVMPEVFDLSDGRFVLAFDRESRLAEFAGRPVPYAAMSGRVLARMLAEQGLGLGLNLDVAPSSILIPASAVAWLVEQLAHAPDEITARISEITTPAGIAEPVIAALDRKLATAAGLAQAAYIAGTVNADGSRGILLAFIDALPEARAALAKAAGEALSFSGVDAAVMDVAFFAATDPIAQKLGRVALLFDLPAPPVIEKTVSAAPGSDPERPPILR